MLDIADADIGGARVRRTFTMGERRLFAGDQLTAEEMLAIPLSNRRALTGANYLEVWLKPQGHVHSERFLVRTGQGKYNVVAGVKINDAPLSLEEAQELAASTPQN